MGGGGRFFFLKILKLGTFVLQLVCSSARPVSPVYKPTLTVVSPPLVHRLRVSFPVTLLVTLCSSPPLPLAAAIPRFSGVTLLGGLTPALDALWPLSPLSLPCPDVLFLAHLVSCSPFLRNSRVNFINVGMEPMLKATQDFGFCFKFCVPSLFSLFPCVKRSV